MKFNSQIESIICERVLRKRGVVSEVDNVILKEEERNSKMNVEVHGIRGDVTVVRLGAGKTQMDHLPSLEGKFKKICDYLLITRVGDKTYAIFVELKKTLSEGDKPYEQLMRSRPLLDYLLSACSIEYRGKQKPQIKYVLIGEKYNERLDKQHVRQASFTGKRRNYRSITVRKFSGAHVSIQDLIR